MCERMRGGRPLTTGRVIRHQPLRVGALIAGISARIIEKHYGIGMVFMYATHR